jgi:uncharacterized repeat protein (TIGR01451 family)
MRTVQARRIAQTSAALAAGFIMLSPATLSVPGAQAATVRPDRAKPSGAPVARRPAGPRLSIGASDGRTKAKAGDLLTYTVSVRNSGTSAAAHLAITLTLPQGVPLVSAGGHGTAAAGKVTWHAGIAAGHAATFRATGRVRHPPARTQRLAAVACASPASGRPTVCAADLDQYAAATAAVATSGSQAATPGSRSATGYVVAGGIAVIAAGALMLVIGRSRRRRQTRHSG